MIRGLSLALVGAILLVAGCASQRDHVLYLTLAELRQGSDSTVAFATEFENRGDEPLFGLKAIPLVNFRPAGGGSGTWRTAEIDAFTDDIGGRNLFNSTETLEPGMKRTPSALAEFDAGGATELEFKVSILASYESATARWSRTYYSGCFLGDGTRVDGHGCRETYAGSPGSPK